MCSPKAWFFLVLKQVFSSTAVFPKFFDHYIKQHKVLQNFWITQEIQKTRYNLRIYPCKQKIIKVDGSKNIIPQRDLTFYEFALNLIGEAEIREIRLPTVSLKKEGDRLC